MTREFETHRFPISRGREWFCIVVPIALGMITGEVFFFRSGPSSLILVPVGAVAVFAGILEALRPGRAVIVTPEFISVPSGWSGASTLRLSQIDPTRSSRLSRWQTLIGQRVIYGPNGTYVVLHSIVLGRGAVERISALIAA